ncbi:MAG: N-acetylneuraminate synthase [Gemmatimonadetes bacterium]|nr:N-acetylneuraminate synthase [Gemmatimonadota bacterium]
MKILGREVGGNAATYFVADIAANHDGNLERAKRLIHLAAEAGADAAKFQNFRAPRIVSDRGFKNLGHQKSHQAGWSKSVFHVYADASLPWEWTEKLKEACEEAGIHYFSAPYDLEAVDMLAPFVPAYKIGSGDITWPEMIERVARQGKPVMLATGASTLDDVRRAMETLRRFPVDVVLMQCNTNYTASLENFGYIQLNVLRTYARLFPDVVLGLSDHTPGHATVLGSVTLGARVVEKHFTDNCNSDGPDHKFSMDPKSWRDMVDRTRELERALGSETKKVEGNEADTVVLQRRAIRAARELRAGTVLAADDLECLRPCPPDGVPPYELPRVVGKALRRNLEMGDHLKPGDV